MAVLGVAERKLRMHPVVVAAPTASLREVPGVLEVLHDVRRRPFGDADGGSDVSEPHGGIGVDALEHVRVVRHEPPHVIIGRT